MSAPHCEPMAMRTSTDKSSLASCKPRSSQARNDSRPNSSSPEKLHDFFQFMRGVSYGLDLAAGKQMAAERPGA